MGNCCSNTATVEICRGCKKEWDPHEEYHCHHCHNNECNCHQNFGALKRYCPEQGCHKEYDGENEDHCHFCHEDYNPKRQYHCEYCHNTFRSAEHTCPNHPSQRIPNPTHDYFPEVDTTQLIDVRPQPSRQIPKIDLSNITLERKMGLCFVCLEGHDEDESQMIECCVMPHCKQLICKKDLEAYVKEKGEEGGQYFKCPTCRGDIAITELINPIHQDPLFSQKHNPDLFNSQNNQNVIVQFV